MRFLKPSLLVAALVIPALVSAQTLNEGIKQPYLNITAANQLDGVNINPNTAAAGNFTTVVASSSITGATEIPTSATCPTNGMYLAAANTPGLCARSLGVVQFTNPTSAVNQFIFTGSATGGLNTIAAGGSGADATAPILLGGNSTGKVYLGGTTAANAALQAAPVASSVNQFVVTPAATGNTPGFEAGGASADATTGVAFGTQGTGTIAFDTNTNVQQLSITHTASAVNNFNFTGSTGSAAPVMSVTGTGTNVNASITGKGTGIVTLGQTICTITGTTPQTCNGQRGIVTTGTLTTAGLATSTFTINNSSVTTSSLVMCTLQAYSGTWATNGNPIIDACTPGTGTIVVQFTNTHAANALNGTLQFGFTVMN